MRLVAIILGIMLASTAAFAQAKPEKQLTTGEVIGIWNAINSLDNHQTGVVDRNGNAVTGPNDYNYSGAVHLAFARNSAQAWVVYQEYQKQVTALRVRLAGGEGKDVPKEKLDDFNRQNADMLAQPASVPVVRIKISDLCLEVKPPACPTKNNIPIATITALLPILDE